MFPGQGSQRIEMGKELFDLFNKETQEASDLLGYDVKERCLFDQNGLINKTQYTQPLLYFVNALSYLKYLQEEMEGGDIFLGHSLGEYNALFAAGVFDLLTGLRLTQCRGEIMALAGSGEGAMAAVIGLSKDHVEKILAEENIANIEIANFNSDVQIVLSGDHQNIIASEKIFKENGAKRYIVLHVSGAFHSKYMQKSADRFSDFLREFQFNLPQKIVYSNVTAKPHVDSESEIKSRLVEQIYSSVRWTQTIQNIRKEHQVEFIEIGPGNVLSGLVIKIG